MVGELESPTAAACVEGQYAHCPRPGGSLRSFRSRSFAGLVCEVLHLDEFDETQAQASQNNRPFRSRDALSYRRQPIQVHRVEDLSEALPSTPDPPQVHTTSSHTEGTPSPKCGGCGRPTGAEPSHRLRPGRARPTPGMRGARRSPPCRSPPPRPCHGPLFYFRP